MIVANHAVSFVMQVPLIHISDESDPATVAPTTPGPLRARSFGQLDVRRAQADHPPTGGRRSLPSCQVVRDRFGEVSEMIEGREADVYTVRVHELEGQVTAFTGISEAIRAVDDVLGQASLGLAGGAGTQHLNAGRSHRREVRTVVLA